MADTRREADISATSFVSAMLLRFGLGPRNPMCGSNRAPVSTPYGLGRIRRVPENHTGRAGRTRNASRTPGTALLHTVTPAAPVRTPTLLDDLDTDDGVAVLLELGRRAGTGGTVDTADVVGPRP